MPFRANAVQTNASTATTVSAWETGRAARMALERAFGNVRNAGRPNGATLTMFATDLIHRLMPLRLPTPRTVTALLELADENEAELIVICGAGWKLLMHPVLGTASLTCNAVPL